MKIKNYSKQKVIAETHAIELDNKELVYLIDYYKDENGKLIDSILRDQDGFDLSDQIDLFEQIVEFIDNNK